VRPAAFRLCRSGPARPTDESDWRRGRGGGRFMNNVSVVPPPASSAVRYGDCRPAWGASCSSFVRLSLTKQIGASKQRCQHLIGTALELLWREQQALLLFGLFGLFGLFARSAC
jgi:hypothetical protein